MRIRKLFKEDPERKLMVAVSGAFMFVISSLKLPSIAGSSSHPTGTGIGTVLYGVGVTSVLATIVLVFQALLLAHGGLTTLGANIFSMGIAGPLAAFVVYRSLKTVKIGLSVSIFFAALFSDLVTYLVTAVQLSLAFPTNGHFLPSFEVFAGVFALTQVPLALVEAVLTVMFFGFLARSRPELIGLGRELKPSRISRRGRVVLASLTIIVVIATAAIVRVNGLVGTDRAGTDMIIAIDPNYIPWASSGIVLDEAGETIMFIIQGFLGLAVILLAWWSWRSKGTAKEQEPFPNTQRWPPLGKLLLTLSLLLASLISRNIVVPSVVLVIGLVLLFLTNRSRMPHTMTLALFDSLLIVGIGAIIVSLVTGGTPIFTLWLGNYGLVFTQQGVALALLVFMRAAAGISIMLFFASSTSIPHLALAMRQLHVPKEIAELVILVYRYSFLVLEQYEKMMLAANCRLGLRGLRISLRTLSKVAVGMFVRSIGVAERAQTSLQCRNFGGDFPVYREPARMGAIWVVTPLLVFVSLFTLNLLTTGMV